MIDRVLCTDTPPRGGRLLTVAAALLLTAGLTLWVRLPAAGLWMLGRIGALGLIAIGFYLAMRWLARGTGDQNSIRHNVLLLCKEGRKNSCGTL